MSIYAIKKMKIVFPLCDKRKSCVKYFENKNDNSNSRILILISFEF